MITNLLDIYPTKNGYIAYIGTGEKRATIKDDNGQTIFFATAEKADRAVDEYKLIHQHDWKR